ncbi:hypothetical protein ACEPPN_007846 [Leptodophora sp. 'Broadleaf-Isolate-01']
MGGLAFDTKSAQGVFIPNDAEDYWIVKDKGVDRLCELHPEILDTVIDRIIDDKSKTGNFGKVLSFGGDTKFLLRHVKNLH